MPAILDRRATARIDGDFVVFLIGMRINKPWKLRQMAADALGDAADAQGAGGGAAGGRVSRLVPVSA